MRWGALITPAGVLAAALALPTAAGASMPDFMISVSPTQVRLEENFTVSGSSVCATVPYTVTLTYTNHAGDNGTATATGTADAAGEFTQPMTMPSAATAHRPAQVQATYHCSDGAGPSNVVDLDVEAYQGALALDRSSAPPGGEVGISGSNCYGGDVDLTFRGSGGYQQDVPATLRPDRTFSAVFRIPDDRPAGSHSFAASCPGTDFEPAAFEVQARSVLPASQSPGVPPPPPPVPRDPCPPGNSVGVTCTPLPGGGWRIVGTPAADRLVGASADDALYGGGGDDRALGLGGEDRAFGFGGDDVLIGGGGDDRLSGGDGRDRVFGLAGDDVAAGGRDGDVLGGGDGDDQLLASLGDDSAAGGAGRDRVFGAGGLDRLFGGGDADRMQARDGTDGELVSCGGGGDRVEADRGDRRVTC